MEFLILLTWQIRSHDKRLQWDTAEFLSEKHVKVENSVKIIFTTIPLVPVIAYILPSTLIAIRILNPVAGRILVTQRSIETNN